MYNTIMLLTTLTALLAIIGGIIGGLFGVITAMVIAIILYSYFYARADAIILKIYRAEPNEDFKIIEILKKLAREAQIPLPKLYLIKTTHFMPNAFALGRDREHSSIAVTGSLLNLKDDEIEAVLAHEVAHIRNNDTLVNMLSSAIAGVIAYPAQLAYWNLYLEGGNVRSGNYLLGIIFMVIFAPIAAFFIRMVMSKKQEYRADYVAALFTKRPRSLARALEKINDSISQKPLKGPAATSHLWIANPLNKDRFNNLFSTHPSIRKRMQKLLELEGRGLG